MKKHLYSLLLGFTVFASLTYTIMIRRSHAVDFNILLRYILVGLVVAGYAYILQVKKYQIAFVFLGVGVLISSWILWTQVHAVSESFSDLGAIIMWMGVLLISMISGLLAQLVHQIRIR